MKGQKEVSYPQCGLGNCHLNFFAAHFTYFKHTHTHTLSLSLSLSYTHTWDNSCLALDKHRKRELTPRHLASRAFISLSQFWHTRRRLYRNRVRSLLSMCFSLLGYSFELRPYSRVLGKVSSVMPSVYHITDALT